MRVLYLSCHEVLAYDEASLLAELGFDVFIVGEKPGHARPSIHDQTNGCCCFLTPDQMNEADGMLKNGVGLAPWLVDFFDVVIIVSRNDWVLENWEKIKHKKVILRLIGQSDEGTQIRMKPFVEEGMRILGYSPHENRRFKSFPILDTIRFYKDPQEWKDWRGSEESVMTLCQSIQRDGECCNPTLYQQVTKEFPRKLYGPGNEAFLAGNVEVATGVISPKESQSLPYQKLRECYQRHRAYFYVGTRPASYTLNFIEAWMSGIPVVSCGAKFNANEVCELIDPEVNGFYSDDVHQLQGYLRRLLGDEAYAHQIGEAGRKKATEVFGKETIKKEWDVFLKAVAGE